MTDVFTVSDTKITTRPIPPEMSAREVKDVLEELRASIGHKAGIYFSISASDWSGKDVVGGSVCPDGITGATSIRFVGDTWREAVENAKTAWAEHQVLHHTNLIRKMALAIIELTADLGECTDAALRGRFDASDVIRHGEAACAQASEMANNGPFSIVKLDGANQ